MKSFEIRVEAGKKGEDERGYSILLGRVDARLDFILADTVDHGRLVLQVQRAVLEILSKAAILEDTEPHEPRFHIPPDDDPEPKP